MNKKNNPFSQFILNNRSIVLIALLTIFSLIIINYLSSQKVTEISGLDQERDLSLDISPTVPYSGNQNEIVIDPNAHYILPADKPIKGRTYYRLIPKGNIPVAEGVSAELVGAFEQSGVATINLKLVNYSNSILQIDASGFILETNRGKLYQTSASEKKNSITIQPGKSVTRAAKFQKYTDPPYRISYFLNSSSSGIEIGIINK